MKSRFYIIGAGGVGSWLCPSLCLLQSPKQVTLVDGDRLEDKNLNRQLFGKGDIGKNKATALASRYGCAAYPHYYSQHLLDHGSGDVLLGCVDNHPARRDILAMCDYAGCRAIIAGNETHSSEAFYYQPDWKDSPLDPRAYYPEILTDTAGDPRGRQAGCTGQAQRDNPQLVSANAMAASLAQHLIVLWIMEAPKLDRETIPSLPFHLKVNLSRLESIRVMDAVTKQTTERT